MKIINDNSRHFFSQLIKPNQPYTHRCPNTGCVMDGVEQQRPVSFQLGIPATECEVCGGAQLHDCDNHRHGVLGSYVDKTQATYIMTDVPVNLLYLFDCLAAELAEIPVTQDFRKALFVHFNSMALSAGVVEIKDQYKTAAGENFTKETKRISLKVKTSLADEMKARIQEERVSTWMWMRAVFFFGAVKMSTIKHTKPDQLKHFPKRSETLATIKTLANLY